MRAEEQGKNEAAHDVLVGRGKVEGKAGEEKAKLRVERKVDRPLRRAMLEYEAAPPSKLMTSRSEPDWRDCWIYPELCALLNFSG